MKALGIEGTLVQRFCGRGFEKFYLLRGRRAFSLGEQVNKGYFSLLQSFWQKLMGAICHPIP